MVPAAPDILIHYHLPKTGGTTLNILLRGNFPGSQRFIAKTGVTYSHLWTESFDALKAKFDALTPEEKLAVRCVTAAHLPWGVHTIFNRPSKYVTVLRHPVDRVVSHFYFVHEDDTDKPISDTMTLDDYIDSRIDLGPYDFQVRMLSGAPELDAIRCDARGPIAITPVEDRHLEMAKRNIEEHFLAAATLEDFTALVLYLRRIYGWSWTKVLFEEINATKARPARIPEATRCRIEALNRYDLALYEWTKSRFRAQIAVLDPAFECELRLFKTVNHSVRIVGRLVPFEVRRKLALWLLYRQRNLGEA
jgi:hypothetical protein